MARMNGSARPATLVTGILDSVSDVIEGGRVASRPNPEVVARAKRRTYTGEYKQQILAEADAARGSGEIGAVLRGHGLYSSHLTKWRQERKSGMLEGLAAHKRGPKSKANLLTASGYAAGPSDRRDGGVVRAAIGDLAPTVMFRAESSRTARVNVFETPGRVLVQIVELKQKCTDLF